MRAIVTGATGFLGSRLALRLRTEGWEVAGVGRDPERGRWLTERGVRITGTDGWSWDVPFSHTAKVWDETHDPAIIWEGHRVGREKAYCHMEKLCNLDQLPVTGYQVICLPVKIKAASAGWCRAVAVME